MEEIVVAIDGPSGVGKSTTSKRVAQQLHLPHIDTGAMYRAVALKALTAELPLDDAESLADLAGRTRIDFVPDHGLNRVLVDGHDVTSEIRMPQVSMAASDISAIPSVRRVLVKHQQEMGRVHGGVLEGRDIGTKVFPETPYKFFLTARPEVRARRRERDLAEKGVKFPPGKVLEEMTRRDHQDSTRADSPLAFDETYTVIDTSDLSIDEVVAKIVEKVRQARIPR